MDLRRSERKVSSSACSSTGLCNQACRTKGNGKSIGENAYQQPWLKNAELAGDSQL